VKLPGRPRAVVLPAVALALLLLSGCGELTPGTAAEVNGTRITNSEVDDLADAQCDLREVLTESGQAAVTSASRVRRESLSLLMDAELSLQYGKSKGISADKLLTKAFLGQVQPFFEKLPDASRTELTDVFTTWSQGRAILVQVGSEATGQQPSPTNTEQLLNAGLQARDGWLKKADIETDAVYAPDQDGFPGGGDGSVSRARSDFAKGATAREVDEKWVTALPAGQRCG
jgi:hypothetical protein